MKRSCAHHYVLDGSTLPMCRTSLSNCSNYLTMNKDYTLYQPIKVGAYKVSTCTVECLFTGLRFKPTHPQISGAWIAAARWPIAASAKQRNTSSSIQSRISFAADAMQLCIKFFFSSWRISHDHQVWLRERLHRAVSVRKSQHGCRGGWMNSLGDRSMDCLFLIFESALSGLQNI